LNHFIKKMCRASILLNLDRSAKKMTVFTE
jgi:hypothetical protein